PYSPPPADAPPRTQLTYSLLHLALFAVREAYYLHHCDDGSEEIMDDTSAGALCLTLDDRVSDVCSRLSMVSTLDDTYMALCLLSDKDLQPPNRPSPPHRPPVPPPPELIAPRKNFSHRDAPLNTPVKKVQPAIQPVTGTSNQVRIARPRPHPVSSPKSFLPRPAEPLSRSIVGVPTPARKRKSTALREAQKSSHPSRPLSIFRSAGWRPTETSPSASLATPPEASPPSKPDAGPSCPPLRESHSLWDDYGTSSSGFSASCQTRPPWVDYSTSSSGFSVTRRN
ncbi:hypothetical protein BD309DRAFT_878930, partial [Dichomitus squalens]